MEQKIIERAAEIIAATRLNCVLALIDLEIKKEMWYNGMENHFKEPEDPNYCVLKFTTERYNLFVDLKGTIGVL